MGGTSVPTLSAQVMAIRNKSIGPEGPPTTTQWLIGPRRPTLSRAPASTCRTGSRPNRSRSARWRCRGRGSG
ncbi:DUF6053 domain-containing protein [Lysobacter enzymogenes]|uniref:DUF6053 domain-containing protein n=1 Tax=Lysobacter enzymogenes TaxID=69 RepID=UPI003D2F596A